MTLGLVRLSLLTAWHKAEGGLQGWTTIPWELFLIQYYTKKFISIVAVGCISIELCHLGRYNWQWLARSLLPVFACKQNMLGRISQKDEFIHKSVMFSSIKWPWSWVDHNTNPFISKNISLEILKRKNYCWP